MNPLASPPYSTDSSTLSSYYSSNGIDPHMRSLLASTWQVLDQPPPPSLREILAAYKQRGDGDREMLLAMLNAKSAEDQRLASIASLQRTMLEIRQTSDASPLPLPQLALPNGTHYLNGQAHYMHTPAPYSPPPPPPPVQPAQQADYSPRQRDSSSVTLPAIRGRPSSGRASGSTESRRKRARHSQSAHHEQLQHQLEPHQSPQDAASNELPPSPSSSLSSIPSLQPPHSQAQRERGAMAIGSLLTSPQLSSASSTGSHKGKERERDRDRDEAWTSEKHQHHRSSRDGPARTSKNS